MFLVSNQTTSIFLTLFVLNHWYLPHYCSHPKKVMSVLFLMAWKVKLVCCLISNSWRLCSVGASTVCVGVSCILTSLTWLQSRTALSVVPLCERFLFLLFFCIFFSRIIKMPQRSLNLLTKPGYTHTMWGLTPNLQCILSIFSSSVWLVLVIGLLKFWQHDSS